MCVYKYIFEAKYIFVPLNNNFKFDFLDIKYWYVEGLEELNFKLFLSVCLTQMFFHSKFSNIFGRKCHRTKRA